MCRADINGVPYKFNLKFDEEEMKREDVLFAIDQSLKSLDRTVKQHYSPNQNGS